MSGASYIGSKISLVSKSDIRYVGILHDIDVQNSTIALEEVVSFGTEGRRGGNPAEEIPPSDNVFKCVVFRGSDVKDLQVFEAPPPRQQQQQQPQQQQQQQQQPSLPQMPSSYMNNGYLSFSNHMTSMYNDQGYGGYPFPQQSATGMTPSGSQQQGQDHLQQPMPYLLMNYPYGFDPYRQQPPPMPHMIGYSGYYPQPQFPPQDANGQPFQTQQPEPPMQMPTPVEQMSKPEALTSSMTQNIPPMSMPSPSAAKKAFTTESNGPVYPPNTVSEEPAPNKTAVAEKDVQKSPTPKPDLKDTPVQPLVKTEKPETTDADTIASSVEKLAKSVSELGIGKGRGNKNNREKRNSPNRPPPSKSSNRSQSTKRSRRPELNGPSVVPEQDFDFASANAKFDKEQIIRSILNGPDETEGKGANSDEAIVIPEADVYYDKSKSFFDDISCDAKERAEAKKSSADYRRKQQEEKKLNLETFGEISVDVVGRYPRGASGGGGRGRNGYRGNRRRNNGAK